MTGRTGIPEIDAGDWIKVLFTGIFAFDAERELTPFQQATLKDLREQIAAADDEIAVEGKRAAEFSAEESRAARDGRNARAKVDLAKMRREKLVAAARAIAEIE